MSRNSFLNFILLVAVRKIFRIFLYIYLKNILIIYLKNILFPKTGNNTFNAELNHEFV